MADFLMPSLGADMSAGTLVNFRKRPGEQIARGEILAEVETDKGVIEIECFQAGTVERLLIEPGSKVPVGAVLATIDQADRAEATTRSLVLQPAAQKELPRALPPPHVEPAAAPLAAQAPESRTHATPSARRLSRQRGIDLASIHAVDPHGTITRHDLELPSAGAPQPQHPISVAPPRTLASPRARALAQARNVPLAAVAASAPGSYVTAADVERFVSSAPAGGDRETRMRRAIAEATSRSKREIPHFYLSQTVPLREPLAWLQRRNEGRPIEARILPIALFARALTRGLRKVPELNGWYVDGRFTARSEVYLTMAVSLRQGGLLAPTLKDADRASLDELSRAIGELIEDARAGRLRSSQMLPGTIGITSLGERGVESVLPVIMPPQVAMVGFGAILPSACVIDEAVVASPAVVLTLAADHRVCDGHRGGLYLRAVARALQEVPDE